MSELPGTAAVVIDSVEWSAETGGNLTVRITGRWRRRRPVGTGQPTLVIEADGRRHRYPAMPEPPSLAGTAPGVWRLSFTIPGWIAPDLGRTWLQFGTVIVPLPVAVPAPGSPAESPSALAPEAPPTVESADEDELAALPGLFASTEHAAAIPDLASRVEALERELRDARSGRDELAASLAERERSRRIAEQRAHAEQALRRDLARQLSSTAQEAERARQAMGELATAEERIRELEEELHQTRRRSDEAEQLAAAATAARQRAEREQQLAEQELARQPRPGTTETERVRFERQMRGHHAGGRAWIPDEPLAAAVRPAVADVEPPPAQAPVEPEPPGPVVVPPFVPAPSPAATIPDAPPPPPAVLAPPDAGVIHTLHQELETRTRADAELRARLIDAESRLAARVLLERRTTAHLAELRDELETLRGALQRERGLRSAAERRAAELERQLSGQRDRSLGAYQAIGELRQALEALRTPAVEPRSVPRVQPPSAPPPEREPERAPPDAPSGAVEPARLSDALTRLRGTIAPTDEPATPEGAEVAAGAPAPTGAPASTGAQVATRTGAATEPVAARAPDTPAGTALQPSMREMAGRPTLDRAFRRLVRADAAAAGRLVLELLPLQRLVYPDPVGYDLVLGAGRGCVCVSRAGDTVEIAVRSAPRRPDEVDFQVLGEPAHIARMLTAGALRRRFGRRMAKVRGDRQGVAALAALLGAPLDLLALRDAGVALDPGTALSLVASMVEPAWTENERFVIGHEEPGTATTYLIVQERRSPQVTRHEPATGVTTMLACRADQLLAALAGDSAAGAAVRGDERPLAVLRQWVKRAQSH
jgi:hypothetical protein